MANQYVNLPKETGGGGSGAVDDVNGATGSVNIAAGQGIDVNTFGDTITLTVIGNANTFAGFDNAGKSESIPGFTIDGTSGGMNEFLQLSPNDENAGISANQLTIEFRPLQDSPNVYWVAQNNAIRFDVDSSGFNQGSNGTAATMLNMDMQHHGTGNVGALEMIKSSFDLGNGTDPISVRGLSYALGFGQINDNVTMVGPIQGYGFQFSASAGATLDASNSVRAFFDNVNIADEATGGYDSMSIGPNIGSIPNNKNFNGLQISPNITTFDGNSGFTGVGIFPTLGTMSSTGNFQGIAMNPHIANNQNYAVGINVNMNDVVNAPGARASLVVQDITYTSNQADTGSNALTVQYTNTATAGSEVASLIGGLHVVVSIQSGVSTATQVRTALLANGTISGGLTFPITGTASNPQVTFAQTNFTGGVNPGRKQAAFFGGDVEIQGNLSFTGALSVGQINAYAPKDIADFTPGVNSIDGLITAPSLADNLTVNGVDMLGVNTAMLLTIGNNSHITTSFIGFAALGLPAVVSMGTGSTIDRVEGAAFAISLDSSASGGTIDEVDLCRALAIPNGVTTVNRLVGFEFDLPFGDPGTITWGVYMAPTTAHNFMAGDLKVGGADVVSNGSVGIELESTTKAIRFSNMTTVQKLALTALPGMMVFDTTLNQMSYFNGTSWVNF